LAVRTSRSGALAFAEEIVRQMFTFLLVIHALIAAALVTVILMQRSEGGGLGMGGGPAGLMTARGAADFLTRATSVLATLFVVMAFVLATVASMRNSAGKIDTSLQNQGTPGPITAPLPAALPATGIPMMGAPTAPATAPQPAPAEAAPAPKPVRTAPTAASLKTIDTGKVTSNSGSIGIGGVSGASSTHKAATPAVTPPAPTPTPAATKPVPTLNLAPPAPAAANGSSPQPQ
jgi:preprotein translocase subunit SecG